MPGRAGSRAWGVSPIEGTVVCCDQAAWNRSTRRPVIWAVRARASADGEDLGDHRGIEDRGDDLQAPATVCAVFDRLRSCSFLGCHATRHPRMGWFATFSTRPCLPRHVEYWMV